MLEFLRIKNLALIKDMSLELSGGINVLTGETGAGKSFIIKAINFALGEKLDAEMVRPGEEKAQVETVFSLDSQELIIKRELHKNGRSRIFINDNLSSQDTLKKYRDRLLYHTSQHAQQQLLNPQFQAALLEKYLDCAELLKEKENLKQHLRFLDEKVKALLDKQKNLLEKRDVLEIQAQEIDKLNPHAGEEDELEEIRKNARQQESALANLRQFESILHGEGQESGLLQKLASLENLLDHAGLENAGDAIENIFVFRSFLADLAKSFQTEGKKFKKVDLDAIEERLFAISQLKRKLKRTFPQILALKDEIAKSLSFMDACKLDVMRLEKEKAKLETELREILNELLPKRRLAGQFFAKALEKQLKDLGFSKDLKVTPDFQEVEIWPGIFDYKGRILWAPNPGQPPQPLDKIASGGELSRFLLALTSLQTSESDVTYIFDEVDAGVGGLTLNKVGEKLENLASNRQIILITHWPQLAARAAKHFYINKSIRDGQTYTECAPLQGKALAKEIERMSGGREGKNLLENIG